MKDHMQRILCAIFIAGLTLAGGDALHAQIAPAAQEAPAPLRVQTGKSLIINSQETLQRISVTDPSVASAVIVSPNQVLINGLKAGVVTLILWDDMNRTRTFNLTVELDIAPVAQAVSDIFPSEPIRVTQSGGAVVLAGNVSSKEVADRAAALAATQAGSVVNLLLPQEGRQVVLLQVRFAEVDRTAITQLGANLFSLGAANTIGTTSTQQFAAPQLESTTVSGVFNVSDLLNVFIFRPDIDLAATIRALQQKNVLQILAEPNVLARNGIEASFLAGGEFPFPVVQPASTGFNAVTIQFKEFGVRLNFTPQILSDGSIRLKVAPEVSALDFTNALTISGFVVPALSTRRAVTEVELRDGQSFAIAGLIDNRLTDLASKIPVLGDIPIIGNLFKSRSTNKSSTELLVMVTPRLVRPLDPSAVPSGPDFPKPFLDRDRFDGPSGETRGRK